MARSGMGYGSCQCGRQHAANRVRWLPGCFFIKVMYSGNKNAVPAQKPGPHCVGVAHGVYSRALMALDASS